MSPSCGVLCFTTTSSNVMCTAAPLSSLSIGHSGIVTRPCRSWTTSGTLLAGRMFQRCTPKRSRETNPKACILSIDS
eukprot:4066803-Amphidinium_carterae.2